MLIHMHTQSEASAMWTIDHNLDLTSMMIEIFGVDKTPILPAKITKTTSNQVVVVFSSARSGTARILGSSGEYINYTNFVAPVERQIDYTYTSENSEQI